MRGLILSLFILILLAAGGLAQEAEQSETAAARLPQTPRQDLPGHAGWQPGTPGGSLRLLTRSGRDARDLVLLGYARLVVWDEDYRLRPDILESFEVEEGRSFTLRLRPGHRWSDGAPFTSEDFRYWWEDVAKNRALSPNGLTPALLVDGEGPAVDFPDAQTVRYSWPAPNPDFLPALAAASPLFIYRPAHYLRRFHAAHSDPVKLAADAQRIGLPDWAGLHRRRDRLFQFDNPELPSLQPWVNTTPPPASRFRAERNPYFHRVDGAGQQLPYIDEVILTRTQTELIPAKAGAGESDLQARGLSFQDYTFLKEAEERGAIQVKLWPIGRGAQLALYPNLNAASPVWRRLMRDRRFRRALSLATDRKEIAEALYQGFALTGNNDLLPASPLYAEDRRQAWARFDPAAAIGLLDEIGLTERDSDGIRLLPDGRPARLVVETANVDPLESAVLELVAESWKNVGIALLIRATARRAARERLSSGVTVMSLFYGLANGLAGPENSPAELAPTSEKQNNWPLWGRHHESNGQKGEAPDLPEAQELLRLYQSWRRADSPEARHEIWQDMLRIHADEVFSIGLIGQVRQPVVANAKLRNLPEEAPYLYEPGAYLGIYRPDTFWFEE